MTGTGQYLRALWSELARGDHGVEPVLLTPGGLAARNDEVPAAAMVSVRPPAAFASGNRHKLWWELVGLPRAAQRARVDLVHVPYFAALPRARRPYVLTIHDLVPWVLPVYARTAAMRVYLRLVGRLATRACLVLTDSDCSARDITAMLPVHASRVRVVPLAASAGYGRLPADDPAVRAVRKRFNLDRPFMFNVGGLDLRKNIAVLIGAFARARPRLPEGTVLVIAGKAHSGQAAVYPDPVAMARDAGIADRVLFTGPVTESEKLALFSLATLYVYPSLYEGFGLSPLEAMGCGTPVLVSNRSSLPEVVGNGGVLAEPDVETFAHEMVRLMNDPMELSDLSARALVRARGFSWRETARLTALAYREALDGWPT